MARKKKTVYSSKFRSGLESEIDKALKDAGIEHYYESEKISYVVPAETKKYLPDFKIKTKKGKVIYLEVKGIWDFQDRKKHALIKRQRPDLDIRFIFSSPYNKIRKGSPTTYADICNGKGRGIFKGLTWKFSKEKIPAEWLKE